MIEGCAMSVKKWTFIFAIINCCI